MLLQVTFSVDGDKLVEHQKGDGFECSHVRHGAGDTLTMVTNANNILFYFCLHEIADPVARNNV